MAAAAPVTQAAGMLALTAFLAIAGPVLTLGVAPAPPNTGPCTAPPPAIGAILRGPVLHVIDGDTFCVALGPTPDQWAPLRLATPLPHPSLSAPPPARGTLMAVAFAQTVTCRVVGPAEGRIQADCEMDGRPIADRLEDPEAIRAGRAWR